LSKAPRDKAPRDKVEGFRATASDFLYYCGFADTTRLKKVGESGRSEKQKYCGATKVRCARPGEGFRSIAKKSPGAYSWRSVLCWKAPTAAVRRAREVAERWARGVEAVFP
jgi:hypothetical protein